MRYDSTNGDKAFDELKRFIDFNYTEPICIAMSLSLACGIDLKTLNIPNRKREVAIIRHYVTWALWNAHRISSPKIGIIMGGKNHSTVLSSKDVVFGLFEMNDKLIIELHNKAMNFFSTDVYEFNEFNKKLI